MVPDPNPENNRMISKEEDELRRLMSEVYVGVLGYIEPATEEDWAIWEKLADIVLAAADGKPLPHGGEIVPFHLKTKTQALEERVKELENEIARLKGTE